jgi:hypothetical protein
VTRMRAAPAAMRRDAAQFEARQACGSRPRARARPARTWMRHARSGRP